MAFETKKEKELEYMYQLADAIKEYDLPKVKSLVEKHNINMNQFFPKNDDIYRDKSRYTPLTLALFFRRNTIRYRNSVDIPDYIFQACYDVVEYIISRGADVNMKNGWNEYPIFWAIRESPHHVHPLLLSHKDLDFNILGDGRNNDGEKPWNGTILHQIMGQTYGYCGDIEYIIELVNEYPILKQQLEKKDSYGKTPLCYLAETDNGNFKRNMFILSQI